MGEIRLEGLVARNSIRQVGEEEQHSHSAGLQGGGVPGQVLQAGLSPAAGFRRLPDVHQHVDGHDRQEQRGGEVDEPGCLQRFLCRGSNPEGSQFRVPLGPGIQDERDEGSGDYAGYAEQSLADVDGHLIP